MQLSQATSRDSADLAAAGRAIDELYHDYQKAERDEEEAASRKAEKKAGRSDHCQRTARRAGAAWKGHPGSSPKDRGGLSSRQGTEKKRQMLLTANPVL